ncbi:MAG: tetratricopeptide repeat protein [Sphingobacteriaceae bacterium]|nr:tetratricopeptide repeat protein [Sphingobacteriaceae bacterium]
MNREERIIYLKNFLLSDPNDVFSNYALGIEYFSDENFNEAEKYFKKVLILNPKYIACYYQMGKLFQTKQENEIALQFLKDGLKLAETINDKKAKNEFEEAIFLLED